MAYPNVVDGFFVKFGAGWWLSWRGMGCGGGPPSLAGGLSLKGRQRAEEDDGVFLGLGRASCGPGPAA